MTLPNLLVIGAPKAGTSSLYRYLGEHPDIYMSPVKEPNYFRGRKVSMEAYAELFAAAGGAAVRGEATPVYLGSRGAAERIREAIPDVRLVAILRQPVDRAISDYSMAFAKATEHASFADAVAEELAHPERKWPNYVRNGFYGAQLRAYYELFDRDQIRVHLYDDLEADAAGLVRRLYEFLGVDPSFEPDTATRHNVTRPPPKHPGLNRMLRNPKLGAVKRLVPAAARQPVRRLARQRSAQGPGEILASTRQQLLEVYLDDIAQLEQLLDRDLSAWLEPGPTGR